MKHFDFFRLFSNNSHPSNGKSNGKNKRKRHRTLRIEELESREMLSADLFNAVHAAYGDLDLGDNWEKYNYIEIQANNLTDAAIRGAVATAGTTSKDDIIVVRTTEEQNKITLNPGMSFTGLVIDTNAAQFGSVTIVSLGDKNLTLDGKDTFSSVFDIASASNVALAGLTITGGDKGGGGGGINNAGLLTVTNCTISGNTAFGSGGGIYNTGSLIVTNSTISGNTANGDGGYYNGGGIFNDGTMTVTNCTISENNAYMGGGICNWDTCTITNSTISGNTADFGGGIGNRFGTLTLTDTTIEENTANGGGGIYQIDATLTMTHCVIAKNTTSGGGGIGCASGTMTVTNCTISKNTATDGSGGGISSGGTLFLANCTIERNTATGSGGGISSGGTLFLANCVVAGNQAGKRGGGIDTSGTSSMTNCVVIGNQAGERGGGIAQYDGALSIINCAIAGNVADLDGGGIRHDNGNLTINNSIVVQNIALSAEGLGKDISKGILLPSLPFGSISGGYNLIGITDGQLTLSDTVLGDPKFVAIPATIDATTTGENYNPDNWDLRLQSGSAAINAGHNSLAVDAHGQLLTSDLDGNPRIFGLTVDLGAYEYCLDTPSPTLLTVNARGNSLAVSWSEVPGAAGYLVQYATDMEFLTGEGSVRADGIDAVLVGLLPETVYYVRVAVLDASDNITSGWSNVFETATLPEEMPDRPAYVTATDVTATSVLLSWRGVIGATGYEIQYSLDGGKTWGSRTTSGDTTVSVDELVAGMYYMFRVRAELDEGMSDWSDIIVAQTLPALSNKPTNVEITDTAATSVTLSWTEVPDAVGYEIQYSLDGGKSWILGTTSNDTAVDVNKLAADTNYLFRVRAVMSEEKSDWSDGFICKTNAAESLVAAAKPKKVAVGKGAEKPTINALTLNISKNMKLAEAANTASYIVSCTSNPMQKFSYTVMGDKIFIEGLQPGTKYTFAVQAIHQNGNISAVVSVKATTAKYTAVKSLKKGVTTADSITLSWKPSTAPAQTTGYVIEVYDATGKNRLAIDVPPITDVNITTVTIPGLDAKTKYTFVVKATDGVYESIAAKIKVATKAV